MPVAGALSVKVVVAKLMADYFNEQVLVVAVKNSRIKIQFAGRGMEAPAGCPQAPIPYRLVAKRSPEVFKRHLLH